MYFFGEAYSLGGNLYRQLNDTSLALLCLSDETLPSFANRLFIACLAREKQWLCNKLDLEDEAAGVRFIIMFRLSRLTSYRVS